MWKLVTNKMVTSHSELMCNIPVVNHLHKCRDSPDVNSLCPPDAYVSANKVIVDSGTGLSPRHQAITWTDGNLLPIGTQKKNQWNIRKYATDPWTEYIWKYSLENDGHFVQVFPC